MLSVNFSVDPCIFVKQLLAGVRSGLFKEGVCSEVIAIWPSPIWPPRTLGDSLGGEARLYGKNAKSVTLAIHTFL